VLKRQILAGKSVVARIRKSSLIFVTDKYLATVLSSIQTNPWCAFTDTVHKLTIDSHSLVQERSLTDVSFCKVHGLTRRGFTASGGQPDAGFFKHTRKPFLGQNLQVFRISLKWVQLFGFLYQTPTPPHPPHTLSLSQTHTSHTHTHTYTHTHTHTYTHTLSLSRSQSHTHTHMSLICWIFNVNKPSMRSSTLHKYADNRLPFPQTKKGCQMMFC